MCARAVAPTTRQHAGDSRSCCGVPLAVLEFFSGCQADHGAGRRPPAAGFFERMCEQKCGTPLRENLSREVSLAPYCFCFVPLRLWQQAFPAPRRHAKQQLLQRVLQCALRGSQNVLPYGCVVCFFQSTTVSRVYIGVIGWRVYRVRFCGPAFLETSTLGCFRGLRELELL